MENNQPKHPNRPSSSYKDYDWGPHKAPLSYEAMTKKIDHAKRVNESTARYQGSHRYSSRESESEEPFSRDSHVSLLFKRGRQEVKGPSSYDHAVYFATKHPLIVVPLYLSLGSMASLAATVLIKKNCAQVQKRWGRMCMASNIAFVAGIVYYSLDPLSEDDFKVNKKAQPLSEPGHKE